MNADKLIKELKAEIVANRALCWVDGKRLVVARSIDGTMTLTKDGKEVVEKLSKSKVVTKPGPKAEKTPTTKE